MVENSDFHAQVTGDTTQLDKELTDSRTATQRLLDTFEELDKRIGGLDCFVGDRGSTLTKADVVAKTNLLR